MSVAAVSCRFLVLGSSSLMYVTCLDIVRGMGVRDLFHTYYHDH